ncbi:hypothetical protein JTE90_025023 [Oedothorax gibbosus]|uniref:Uncharacterized protein n=1 Tax=Oedothorax gibbosus TaxID=931172 RepID=A0AAV6TM55_9ARAC|nr:hypothetical protein JTE90_025023 [Oedothorax gibbosus]
MLTQVLVAVGGKDVRSILFNCLRRIMTHDVAEIISLSGKALPGYGSKHPFLQIELCKVLFVHKVQRMGILRH